jgi:branched-chain amino acid transport system permease protein
MNGSARGRTLFTAATLILVVALVAAVGGHLSGSLQRTIADALIKTSLVVGTYVFIGNSGILSFGHIGFFALGAYTTAWLTISPSIKESLVPDLPGFLLGAEISPYVSPFAGGAVAAFVALLVGVPLSRMSGIAASIGTFAMLIVIYSVASNWTTVTGGQGSLYGLPMIANLPASAAAAILSIAGAALYQASAAGFRLRGSREDSIAAQASGVDVRRERLLAFVISAFFVGVAGAVYAHFLQVVVASEFYLNLTFVSVAMLVIGGMRSLTGAVIGVAFVTTLTELLRQFERGVAVGGFVIGGRPGVQELGLAIAMLLVILLRPRGLSGGREIADLLPNFRRDPETKSQHAPRVP